MFDPAALLLVIGTTLLASLLQAGPDQFRIALAMLAARRFDAEGARAALARQIAALDRDGLLHARAEPIADTEFALATGQLLRARSLEAMLAAHRQARAERAERSAIAGQVWQQAADLAPMMGLAGTLVSLGSLAPAANEGSAGGLAGAIGMAVLTTLYGVLASSLVFAPLAGLIARRARAEDAAREALYQWLESHAGKAAPRLAAREAA